METYEDLIQEKTLYEDTVVAFSHNLTTPLKPEFVADLTLEEYAQVVEYTETLKNENLLEEDIGENSKSEEYTGYTPSLEEDQTVGEWQEEAYNALSEFDI